MTISEHITAIRAKGHRPGFLFPEELRGSEFHLMALKTGLPIRFSSYLAADPIYDMGYSRTGCVFCAFGAHLEKPPNRFQRLHDTHPKLWRYCMDKLNMRDVLSFLNIPFLPNHEQTSLLEGP